MCKDPRVSSPCARSCANRQADLVRECEERGLPSEGTVPTLRERVKAARKSTAPAGSSAASSAAADSGSDKIKVRAGRVLLLLESNPFSPPSLL